MRAHGSCRLGNITQTRLTAILAVTLVTAFSSTATAAPPVANANLDQIVPVGSLVVLDGSPSFDADGDSLAYAWTITAAPAGSSASLSGDTSSSPTFVADSAGFYTVRLVVTAGGETSQDTVRVQATSAGLENGLLGYWRFDETATQTVFDSSGNANDGVIVSGGRTVGKFGGALTFSGSNNSHASVPRNPGSTLFDITDQMTVSVWVYPTEFPDGFRAVVQSQIGTLVHPDQFYLGFGPRNGSMWYKWHLAADDFGTNANGDIYEGVPDTNRWIHMVGTYDGSIMRLYVDGAEIGTFVVQGDVRIDDNPIVIGSEENSSQPQVVTRGFKGHVDELRIYNRALSSAEVTELYSGPGGANSAPQLVNPGNQVATEGLYTELQIQASDGDGDLLTIDGNGLPPGLDIDAAGLISGTPSAPGVYRVSVDAFDGMDTSSISFDWSVLPESGGPIPLLGVDIGDVAASGSTFPTAAGYVLEGSGSDIYRRADEFQFAYRQLSGDGEIIARVISVEDTDAWAKAGVMVRASLDDDAINAMMAVTPGKGIEFQYRAETGGGTRSPSPSGASAFPFESAPAWVRLVRSGNQITGFISSDGANWTPVPSGPVVLSLATDVYVGLAVTSHNDGVLALAEFDGIRVVTNGGSGPTNTPPWLNNPGPQLGTVGESVSLQLIGGDDDGDSVEFSAVGLPPGLAVTLDGLIAGTPTTAGAYLVDATVTDGTDSTTATFTWDVSAVAANSPPTIANPGPQLTEQDVPVTLQIQFDDADGDPVTVIASGLPPGLSMDAAGEISGAPIAAGVFNVTVEADDGEDITAINFTWTVTTPGAGPVFASLDIGDVAAAGSYVGNGQAATILGSGRDIFRRADEFHFAYQQLSGDGEIIARVISVEDTAGWAKAGVMIRASLADDAINAMMAVTPRNGIEFQYRAETGGGTRTPSPSGTSSFPGESAPAWVRLVRSGNQLTGFISDDGANWTPVPTGPVVLPFATDVFIGLAVTSHNDGVLALAEFDGIRVVTNGGSGPTNTPPWLSNPGPQLGTVGESVSLQLIGGDDDGDSVEFSAVGLPPGLGVTLDGLIMGTPTTAGAYLVDATVTDGIDSTTATFTWDIAGVAGNAPPTIVNPGPQLTEQDVPVTLQIEVGDDDGDPVTITASGLPPGLSMDAAGEISGAPNATGVFNVTVDADDGEDITTIDFTWTVTTPGAGPVLTSLDIGDVAAAGSYVGNGQAATILASGRDIFRRADEFHFAYQRLSGDGEIIARVISVENTAGWAKAGVMIRASLDDNAINAMMAVTPSKGIEFQYRPETGGGTRTPSPSGVSIFPSESAPAWVRLVRSGNQVTGFISDDGVNWTPVPTGPVVLPFGADVYVGLAVTSHNDGVLTTAEFDAVTIR